MEDKQAVEYVQSGNAKNYYSVVKRKDVALRGNSGLFKAHLQRKHRHDGQLTYKGKSLDKGGNQRAVRYLKISGRGWQQ